MSINQKKQNQPSLNLIRAVSAVAIVLFHYSYTFYEYGIPGKGPDFLRFVNADWGGVFVAVFFMLSGAALIYNHPRFMPEKTETEGSFSERFMSGLKSLAVFWKKRWLSLFPMFYVAWIIMYVINSRRVGTWYWGGPRKNFLFSFFGMDGYFMHLGQNYYCLGEWFLGGIIFLYLLFPVLQWMWQHMRIAGSVILTFFYVFNLYRNAFSSAPDTNIFIVLIKYYNSHITISDNMCLWTCMMNFWLGFALITYVVPFLRKEDAGIKKRNIAAALLSVIVITVIALVEMPVPKIICCTISAVGFYVLFTAAANLFPALAEAKIIKLMSKYSYGIFLVHHVILYGIMALVKTVTFNRVTSLIFFIPVFVLIFVVGALLHESVHRVQKLLNGLLHRKAA